MRTFEVFLKRAGKEEFRHAGSMQAPDIAMARLLARESYSRRGEGDQMWLIDRVDVVEVEAELLAATSDVPHRSNDGAEVAAHRKRLRQEGSS